MTSVGDKSCARPVTRAPAIFQFHIRMNSIGSYLTCFIDRTAKIANSWSDCHLNRGTFPVWYKSAQPQEYLKSQILEFDPPQIPEDTVSPLDIKVKNFNPSRLTPSFCFCQNQLSGTTSLERPTPFLDIALLAFFEYFLILLWSRFLRSSHHAEWRCGYFHILWTVRSILSPFRCWTAPVLPRTSSSSWSHSFPCSLFSSPLVANNNQSSRADVTHTNMCKPSPGKSIAPYRKPYFVTLCRWHRVRGLLSASGIVLRRLDRLQSSLIVL